MDGVPEKMRVEILGHWVSAPAVGASGACSSYAVTGGGTTVLLDCGPGTVPLLQERDLTRRLDAVVISHVHPDHMLDLLPLASLLNFLGLLERLRSRSEGAPRKKPRLLVPRGGSETLTALNAIWYGDRGAPGGKDATESGGVYRDVFADAFDLEEYGEDDRLQLDGLTISFRRTRHSGPCFSPRVTDGRATVVYSADTGYAPEVATHAKGADLFICEATFLNPHPFWTELHGHMTGAEAGRLAAQAQVKRQVLTHLGPHTEDNEANLEKARAEFGGEVDLARTGSVYHV